MKQKKPRKIDVLRVCYIVQPNNALHLQTTAVIILASARMPPYASFKLA
jgi:hypothetical protein